MLFLSGSGLGEPQNGDTSKKALAVYAWQILTDSDEFMDFCSPKEEGIKWGSGPN